MKKTHSSIKRNYLRRRLRLALLTTFAAGISLLPSGILHAASLSSSSLALSDPRPAAAAVSYAFSASNVTLSAIKCIKMVYSTTSSGTGVPSGMITTSSTLDTVNTSYIPTPANWTIGHATNGTVTLTNASGETPASASSRKVTIAGITNPTTAGTTYFMQFSTFTNTDCATGPIDAAVVDFDVTYGATMTLNVDPTLSFSVNAVASGQTCNGATSTQPSTSTTIPFGTVTSASNSVVCQDLTASTNAANGYTVYVRSTQQPTNSLGQTIAPVSGTNTTPSSFPAAGTEAYGYTTSDSSLGTGTPSRFQSNLWAAVTTANAEVAYEATGVSSTTYRIGHQVGVSQVTRPGAYQTTIIYTCTPVY